MNKLIDMMANTHAFFLEKIKLLDFTALLLIRIYLAPIFILAGWGKLNDLESTAYYFGEYLGLPLPDLMAFLAGSTEFFGGIAILIGIATRWFSIPLMVTMVVAATTAHWGNGWHALPETTLTVPWEWRMDLIQDAVQRRDAARSLLEEHGNYEWLTGTGSITVLKNGIEFAATYFIMLLPLLFFGAGRASVDHLLRKKFML